jgi:tetrahydromethanopterin S-methyltransferase subunit G
MPEVEERLARFETRTETLLTQLEKRLADGFAAVDKRFDDLQTRMTSVEGRIASLDSHMDSRFTAVDTRFMGVEGRLTNIEARLDQKAGAWLVSIWGATLAMLIAAATALIKRW